MQMSVVDPGINLKKEGGQPIIRPKFLENCMKIKKIGQDGRPKLVYVDPLLEM